jgi:hypothetical protein
MTDEEIRTDNTETLVNALERIAELEKENAELRNKLEGVKTYLAYGIPHELMNEATNKIWHML